MKFTRFTVLLVVMAAFAIVFPVLAQDATPEITPEGTVAPASPDAIVLGVAPGSVPEGVTYNSINSRFFVGSVTTGTVSAIADDGTATPFIQSDDLMGTFGMRADADHNRLYITNSDPSPYFGPDGKGNMMVGIYDLTTGELIHMVDLNAIATPDARHAVNDVTFDKDGNIYGTDSFSPSIYKIDPDGNASVFLTDPQFSSDSIGLNGLAYSADGYLIVSNLGASKLFKVPLDDPQSFTEVMLESPISVDGMAFAPDGSLAVVGAQADQTLYQLTTTDDWATATVAGTFEANQTITAVTYDGDQPVVLFTSFDPAAPSGSYQLVPVEFTAM